MRVCVCVCVCMHTHALTGPVPLFCNPMDCSPPGFSVHGILQARILEWVAVSFSRESSNPGIEPASPELWADSLPSEPPGKPNFSKLDAPYFLFQVSLLHIVMLFGPGCTNALGSTYILFPDAM